MPKACFRVRTTINADPDDVIFQSRSQISLRHGQWAANQLQIEPVSAGPTTIGSRYRSTAQVNGITFTADLHVTGYHPFQEFAFAGEDQTGRFEHQFTLRPDNQDPVGAGGLYINNETMAPVSRVALSSETSGGQEGARPTSRNIWSGEEPNRLDNTVQTPGSVTIFSYQMVPDHSHRIIVQIETNAFSVLFFFSIAAQTHRRTIRQPKPAVCSQRFRPSFGFSFPPNQFFFF